MKGATEKCEIERWLYEEEMGRGRRKGKDGKDTQKKNLKISTSEGNYHHT